MRTTCHRWFWFLFAVPALAVLVLFALSFAAHLTRDTAASVLDQIVNRRGPVQYLTIWVACMVIIAGAYTRNNREYGHAWVLFLVMASVLVLLPGAVAFARISQNIERVTADRLNSSLSSDGQLRVLEVRRRALMAAGDLLVVGSISSLASLATTIPLLVGFRRRLNGG